MTIALLVLVDVEPAGLARLRAAGFEPHLAPTPAARAEALANQRPEIRAVLTNGSTGLAAAEMAMLPALEIVCAQGVGFERIELPAARARGLVVTHGPGTNDATVADHALALMLALIRGVPAADALVRSGAWAAARQPRPMVTGKRLGILGLGRIGHQIARRAADGFAMPVAYHSRHPVENSPYLYQPSPAALAEWCEVLVVAAPGGAATRHLIDAPVLAALGPAGYLVNIGRGSVVDTQALVAALHDGRIAGAALDVFEGEPQIPPDLVAAPNLVLTPHIAGRSPEAIDATIELVIDNLTAHFAGQPVKTPVP